MQYTFKLTPKQRYEAFPYQLIQFVLENFDSQLIEATLQFTQKERSVFVKNLALTLGSFILPKQVMKSFNEPTDIFCKEAIT